MNRNFITTIILSSLGAAGASQADLTVASVFGDHAVLQRQIAVPVWGTGDPGAKVTTTFRLV